ncbi:TetR/AcrR family transcriptional regulator [Bacillus sp. JJ1764]|uniref:TetR/AcrR family transcriptional regulator n=1 Tax=Bacillus sp. JJ1764 TaxID=3122964 RepID=UPI002FFFAD4F
MYSKFLNLEKEKQDRIINAAINEFAQKGFDKASTNEIVKGAEISKGLLFHYFQNKKQLYFFLFDYCYEMIADAYYQHVDLDEKDFFARVQKAVILKMQLQKDYPALFKFMESACFEDSNEVKQEMELKIKQLSEVNFGKIFEGIDTSKFRDDVDVTKILKIITWTLEKVSEEERMKVRHSPSHEINYAEVKVIADEYLEILAKCFYK